MRHFYKLSIVFTALLLLSYCSDGTQKEEKKGPQETSESAEQEEVGIGIGIEVEETKEGKMLTIAKSSLGQEFLLQGEIAWQRSFGERAHNPTSEGLKSRIVIFKENGDELLMLDSNAGFLPGDEIPAYALITAFPIKGRKNNIITFDFDGGMNKVFESWDWYVSDYYGETLWPDFVLSVENSFLRDAAVEGEAATAIQTVSARGRSWGWEFILPVEVTYYITPYKGNPNYIPVESPGFNYLGFFEANPVVQKGFGEPFTYISRFDISKPVTYYISSAVPEKYRQAVKEGVLYWNKAFGKEVMRAEMAPEGLTAPDFKHNIIQWHTDLGTGAYADAQLDPRTGEILHTQIFISNAFTEWARAYRVAKLDRELEDGKQGEINKDAAPGEVRLKNTHLCQLDFADLASQIYTYRDVVQELPPERIESAAIDFLRIVVAHEVGHTLGLRHNFAANLVNEWSGLEEDEITRGYLKEGKLPDNMSPPINSVMEYPYFADDLIAGAHISREDTGALPYDRYAMQWGYFGWEKDPAFAGHPFCTDSQVYSFNDCRQHDSGGHLIERSAYEAERSLKKIPRLLSEVYLASKANFNPRWRKPVTESTPPSWYLTGSVMNPLRELLSFLTDDISLISINSRYPDLIDIDQDKIEKEALDWVNAEVANAGGITEVLKLINPGVFQNTVDNFRYQFEGIIASDAYKNISLPEGGSTSFTNDEIDYMSGRARELFREVDKKLTGAITKSLLIESRLKLIDEIEKVGPVFAAWAEYIIVTGPAGLEFRYPIETRREAVSLLRSPGPFFTYWLDDFVPAIAEKLRQKLEAYFGMPLEQVDVKKFPLEEQQRILDELGIFYSLMGTGQEASEAVQADKNLPGAFRYLRMLLP